MPEYGARLRQTGVRAELLNGRDIPSQQRDVLLTFLRSLAPLLTSLGSTQEGLATAADLREPIYLFALLCALSGVEMASSLDADLAHRELTLVRAKPGEAAPIPDKNGMLRDPVDQKPSRI